MCNVSSLHAYLPLIGCPYTEIVKKHLTTTHTLEVIDGMKRDNYDASSS